MIQTTSVTEKALLSHLECPLRAEGANAGPEPPILHCAERTYQWLLAEIAAGRQPTACGTREYFDTWWQQTNYFHSRDGIPVKQYNRSLMEGVHACARLRDLLWTHEILQPVAQYELPVDGIVITGEYALLVSTRRKTRAVIPYLHYKGLKIRPVIPDIVTFARWVDASSRLPVQQWRVKQIAIMHYWLTPNLAAEYQPNPAFATQVLRGAVRTISLPAYPRTGEHCLACPTHNCRIAVSRESLP